MTQIGIPIFMENMLCFGKALHINLTLIQEKRLLIVSGLPSIGTLMLGNSVSQNSVFY